KPGRGTQMNAGSQIADGEILIFLHADTQLPSGSLDHISKIIKTGKYKSGAFSLQINSQRKIYRLIEFFASLRCRLTRIPYGDQAIFITKSYFQKIGRFSEIPIMEDIDLMHRIRQRGDKVYISSKCVKTSPRRWEKEGIVYCVIRSSILALLFRLGVPPHRLLKYYKIFRNETSNRK
ncbi:MAG: TIGR04283 family arsenosugar biosynthesis glycosyltransferase, partial [Desulfamplus sp.]|nr:TIGR04283 family arsenosugar biosynthesis glycosyltransferase [Desulfamplus sp.]